MWFIVTIQAWKHWDSVDSEVFSVPIYDVDEWRAISLATDAAFEKGFGAVRWAEVWVITTDGPKLIQRD